MDSGSDDRSVQKSKYFADFRCTSADNFFYDANLVLFISGINSFRAVSAIEINIKLQPAEFFKNRHTVILCASWIHRRFVYNDSPIFHCFSDSFTCLYERSKVGAIIFIDRSWHRYNKNID